MPTSLSGQDGVCPTQFYTERESGEVDPELDVANEAASLAIDPTAGIQIRAADIQTAYTVRKDQSGVEICYNLCAAKAGQAGHHPGLRPCRQHPNVQRQQRWAS
jgi:hypothetical protein